MASRAADRQQGLRRGARWVALLAGLLMAPIASPARAESADLVFGAGRDQGPFLGDTDVDLDTAWLGAEFGGVTSRLVFTIPYVRIDGTGLVTLTPEGPAVVGAGGPGRPPWQESEPGAAEGGLGDVVVMSRNYLMKSGAGNRPTLTFDVDFKWATADESKGLGTGENDYGGGFDYVQPMGQHVQLLGRAFYRFSGSPEGIEFEDRLYLRGGLGFVSAHTVWRLHYETVDALLKQVPQYDDSGAAIAFVEVEDYEAVRGEAVFRNKAGGSWKLWALAGLNDSSPDIGFGLTFASRGL